MLYKDIYTGEIFTREALQSEYEALRESGDTEAKTFSEYMKNCTDKDGALVIVKDYV